MNTHRISDAAKARQEAARESDGKFGFQHHDRADGVSLEEPGLPVYTTADDVIEREIVPALGEDVGDYDTRQIVQEAFEYDGERGGFVQTVTDDQFWSVVQRAQVPQVERHRPPWEAAIRLPARDLGGISSKYSDAYHELFAERTRLDTYVDSHFNEITGIEYGDDGPPDAVDLCNAAYNVADRLVGGEVDPYYLDPHYGNHHASKGNPTFYMGPVGGYWDGDWKTITFTTSIPGNTTIGNVQDLEDSNGNIARFADMLNDRTSDRGGFARLFEKRAGEILAREDMRYRPEDYHPMYPGSVRVEPYDEHAYRRRNLIKDKKDKFNRVLDSYVDDWKKQGEVIGEATEDRAMALINWIAIENARIAKEDPEDADNVSHLTRFLDEGYTDENELKLELKKYEDRRDTHYSDYHVNRRKYAAQYIRTWIDTRAPRLIDRVRAMREEQNQ